MYTCAKFLVVCGTYKEILLQRVLSSGPELNDMLFCFIFSFKVWMASNVGASVMKSSTDTSSPQHLRFGTCMRLSWHKRCHMFSDLDQMHLQVCPPWSDDFYRSWITMNNLYRCFYRPFSTVCLYSYSELFWVQVFCSQIMDDHGKY